MRLYFLSVIVSLIFISSNAQVMNNRLNIAFGPAFSYSLNKRMITDDEFQYPSLYGNYIPGLGGEINIDYLLTNNLWIGVGMSNIYFLKWTGDEKSFVLQSPNSVELNVMPHVKFIPSSWKEKNLSRDLGFFFRPQVNIQFLKWDAVNQLNRSGRPDKETDYYYGFGLGTFLYSNERKTSIELGYNYFRTNNMYYVDKNYHSVSLSFKFVLHFLKNKYFIYE